jgi:uncharacterized integral membrane protein
LPAGPGQAAGVKQILGWVVVVVTAVFVLMNMARAQVWFFGISAQMPIAFVVLASAALGALGSYAFVSMRSRK